MFLPSNLGCFSTVATSLNSSMNLLSTISPALVLLTSLKCPSIITLVLSPIHVDKYSDAVLLDKCPLSDITLCFNIIFCLQRP